MVAFFENTWFIWWVFAIVAVMRWVRAASCDGEWDEFRAERRGQEK